ncbi:hypothetical protein BD560DRAFT_405380 [Blakeslea trispora]|nr:hypothetical protein BD560DRAFT_405380 [Blakeslea trispora]
MQAINDSHLAYLLSLGFEIELCQQALKDNATLEDATEWILNPNRTTVSRPQQNFVAPSTPSSSLAQSFNQDFQKENEEMKQTQRKESEKFTKELKRAKQLDREAKKKVLADIQKDKELRRTRLHQVDRDQPTKDHQPNRQPNSASCSQQALVQLKLTDSSTIRQSFSPELTIDELLNFVYEKERNLNQSNIAIDTISLISVFPRRNFTYQDSSVTLRDAGFLPNVSLNVHISRAEESSNMNSSGNYLPTTEESHYLNEEDEDMQEPQDAMDIDEAPNTGIHQVPANMANRHWARTSTGIQPINTASVSHTEISDDQETNPEIRQQTDERRNLFLYAIQHHIDNNQTTATNSNDRAKTGLERHSKSLKDICASSVSVFLSQHSTTSDKYLAKAYELPSSLAEYLMKHLKTNGKLNVSNLNRLASHCYLQNILLDTYVYCTDSLILSLSKTSSSLSISRISLRGCDMITDIGIGSLSGLKQLDYLDLSNCKLTDKGLKSLGKLCHLVYLNLSKTKITSKGLSSMLHDANYKEALQTLILDGCNYIKSSNPLVPIINGLPNLIQLSLALISMDKLEATDRLRKNIQIRNLNISQTNVSDEDLIGTISQFRLLQELNLSNCNQVSTKGLAFLPTELKHLEYVQFPNNENELDGVLARYRNLPIKKLELSSFCITDEGARYIAFMKRLQLLNLEGTKVTDQGVSYFKDLVELEKLYLDRTEVTDEGIEYLIGLSKLDTLSLSHTAVSNKTSTLIGNSAQTAFTRGLRTLNLSHCTNITDKGVRSLSGKI